MANPQYPAALKGRPTVARQALWRLWSSAALAAAVVEAVLMHAGGVGVARRARSKERRARASLLLLLLLLLLHMLAEGRQRARRQRRRRRPRCKMLNAASGPSVEECPIVVTSPTRSQLTQPILFFSDDQATLRKHGDGEAAADDDDDDDDEPVEPKLTAKQRRDAKALRPRAAENVDEDDEEDDEEDEEPSTSNPDYPSVTRKTTHKKKKVLAICSRGATSSNVELMEDVIKLLPHARKDPKFDKKEALTSIVEIAQLAGCHLALYFEARKMRLLYLWAGRIDGGPSVKFLWSRCGRCAICG